jgi:prepilin-type N-terminal cleavage/methylation domain-containing protein
MSNIWKKKQTGFTMIELIVSIFIIVMITTLVMANYRTGQRRYELKNSILQMVNDLRTAENYALGLKKNELITAGARVPRQGWGIYLDKSQTSYVIFADDDAISPVRQYEATEKYATSSLLKGVVIDEIKISSSTPFQSKQIDLTKLSIVFIPPDPLVYINNSSSTSARIVLRHTVNQATSTIEVNSLGMVNVK